MNYFGIIKGEHSGQLTSEADPHTIVPVATQRTSNGPHARGTSNSLAPLYPADVYDADDNPDQNSRAVEFDPANQSFWKMLEGFQQRPPSSLPQLPEQSGQPQIPGTARSAPYPSLKAPSDMAFAPDVGIGQSFDIGKAASLLAASCQSESGGACREHVLDAIDGATLAGHTTIRAAIARVMHEQTNDHGANHIVTAMLNDEQLKRDYGQVGGGNGAQLSAVWNYQARVGDIAVWEGGRWGHVEMCVGHRPDGSPIWRSDFTSREGNWTGLKEPDSHGSFRIFRQHQIDIAPTATASADAPTPAPAVTDPTGKTFTNDNSVAAFATRDANGTLVAGNNVNNVVHIASLAKVATLWSSLHLLKENHIDVDAFVKAHKGDIANMMNCSDPATYNQAAVRVMHAAAQSLQVSDATFLAQANQSINQINVNGDRVTRTHIDDPRGGESTSTAHDLSLVMHQARSEFSSVFQNNNQYRTDVFDACVGTTFSKPGEINGVRTQIGVVRGSTYAVAVDERGHQTSTNQQLDNRLKAGTRAAERAALGQAAATPPAARRTPLPTQ